MNNVEQTEKRVNLLDRRVGVLEAQRAEREKVLKNLEKELTELSVKTALLDKVDKVLLAVSAKVLGQSIDTIDKMVTAGLKITFDDQNLEFRATTGKSRGKTSVTMELFKDGKAAPIMDAYGGGVVVVIGMLLRIVVIMALGLRRVLILDESLSHLSFQYVGNCSRLMSELCRELDFTIIMVTHEEGFAEYADYHYEAQAKQGGPTEFKLMKELQLEKANVQPEI